MRLALIGYGKMGKSIEKEAISRGHDIVLKTSITPKILNIKNTNIDVAIEFSNPESAFENVKICLENKIAIVCGTTGWLDRIDDLKEICKKENAAFIYSSNFSIGMNILFKINKILAEIMNIYNEYNIYIEEIHHKQKIDIPSGTSITLANDIIKKTNKKQWTLKKCEDTNKILIKYKRLENITGIHTINYESNIDKIELKHQAYNRRGFAIGAVIAAEWIKNKNGFFSMEDVLDI